MDQTSTVEILDRCSVCVASKRSAQYCRVTLAHTASRATVCASCLDSQATVTECRLKEGHRDPGVSTNVAVSDLQSYKLPQCCTQLTSLSLSKDKAGLSTCTGFMRGYTTKKSCGLTSVHARIIILLHITEPPRNVAQAVTTKSVKRLSLRRPDK